MPGRFWHLDCRVLIVTDSPAKVCSAHEYNHIQFSAGISLMNITRVGSQPSIQGPADWFTGAVRIDTPFKGNDPARVTGAIVTFEPGARTAWHTHPLGQTLLVTAGCGWAQREGGPVEEIHPGDIVWFAPGEKHWHGAAPTTAMTHVALQEVLEGKAVHWMEKVTDDQYRR
jgi:quercetin dioxygenase-like cupin family protein